MPKIILTPEQVEDSTKMAEGGDLPNYSLAGTGKTLTALEAFKKAGHKQGLIIAPPIAQKMWQKVTTEWLGADVAIATGSNWGTASKADILVTTYDVVGSPMMQTMFYRRFSEGALILDEAHNARGKDTKRNAAIFGRNHDGEKGLMEKFDNVWPLSGNPIFRYADDLWGQLVALYPDVFAKYRSLSYEAFVLNFCVVKVKKFNSRMQPRPTVVRSQNLPILHKMLYEDIGAIRRQENTSLPPIRVRELFPTMESMAGMLRDLFVGLTDAQIEAKLEAQDADMQAVWRAAALAKVKGAKEYVLDSSLAGPLLIGYWHTPVGDAYYDMFKEAGLNVARVKGGMTANKKEELRDRFNAGEFNAMVGQMGAMGVSWNLQEVCQHVIIAQDHYSPAVIEQFYKRVQRLGQQNQVTLDFLMGETPVDTAIKRIRLTKEKEHRAVLGDGN